MLVTTAFASTEHIDDIARIGYDAFHDVAARHGFIPDFPTFDLARQVYRMLVGRKDYYGVVALVDGKVVGSNFISTTDTISGIGPLSVDPDFQSRGIGRSLRQNILDFTHKHRIGQVRLLADAHNTASISLYSSLGFAVRDTVALMTTVPSEQCDPSIRSIKTTDLLEIEELSNQLSKSSRYNEVLTAINSGFPAVLRQREGQICGYLVPGLVGHGMALTEGDALALLRQSARDVPPVFAKFFCPLRYGSLFRSLLLAGANVEKMLVYMSLGPFEYPDGVCTPSAGY
jgi:predicted N-acetyltransferase YhbS